MAGVRARVCRRVAPLALLAGVVGLVTTPDAVAADKVESKAPARSAKKADKVPKDSGRSRPKGAKEQEREAPAKSPEADAAKAPKRSPAADSEPRSPTVKDEAAAGPRQGAGSRSLEPAPPPKDDADGEGAAAKAEPKAVAGRLPHQKGPIPKKPNATLPKGAPRQPQNTAARREVAGGPTADDLRAGKEDTELKALKLADRVLFPKPLDGARPGWSWDLPEPVENGDAEVVASGLPPEPRVAARPGPEAGVADVAWIKSLALPNLPVRFEARVVTYLKFYRDDPQGRNIARVWAQKSGRYAPALRAALSRAGLPTDLLYLSLIESGHNPTIVSAAGAAGLWQFMPDAGRMYGLTVDRWVDERFDAQRSTDGAVRYLSDLYRRFGNWDLAMAAYNMGLGGLSRAIKKFNTNDFWELSRYEAGIPWETTLYVPKILAIAVVMNNRRAFGLGAVTSDPPVSFESVLVDPGVPLDRVANVSGVSLQALEALNPQYLSGRTPPSRAADKSAAWPVRLPAGKALAASRRLPLEAAADPTLESYAVKQGDTLESIALSRRTSAERVREVNQLGRSEALAAGTLLLLPKHAAPAEAPSRDPEVVVVPPRTHQYADRERVFYRVAAGDSLAKVASALGIARADLLVWNAIDESARLQPGMVLQVYLRRGADPAKVRLIRESDARVLVAGSDQFFDYYEGLNGRRRITVVARSGDTLQSIGRRHGMSPGSMERINRRPRGKKLEPGETVVVYTQRPGLDPPAQARKAEPLPPVVPPFPEALPASGTAEPAAVSGGALQGGS